jgi:hypothetical protein
MYAWVLIIWIGGGYAGNLAFSDIASEGDCHFLAAKIVQEQQSHGGYASSDHACLRYKKAE